MFDWYIQYVGQLNRWIISGLDWVINFIAEYPSVLAAICAAITIVKGIGTQVDYVDTVDDETNTSSGAVEEMLARFEVEQINSIKQILKRELSCHENYFPSTYGSDKSQILFYADDSPICGFESNQESGKTDNHKEHGITYMRM